MASFRDIWNLIVTGDTSDVDRKLKGLGKTTEDTGATADKSLRGRMGDALGNVAQKIPGVSGLMDKFGVSSSQAGALMGTAVAGGALAAGTAVAQFVQTSIGEFQKQSQEVLHFKEVTGLAADEASRFVAVADDFGVSASDLSTEVGRLNKTAEDSPGKLKAVGVEIAHTKDGAYDAQQTFLNVVDAFNNTDDAAVRASIGSAAFGKNWASMVNLLDQGSGKLKDSFSSVADFQMFSDADLAESERYRHSMDDLNDAVHGFEREVGQAAIPVVIEFTKQLTDMAETADRALKPFGGLNLLMQTAATVVFPAYESSGGSVADASRAMVEEAKKNVDQMEAIALATPKATRMVDAFRASIDLTVGSGADYVRSNSEYRQALIDTREELERATKATQDYQQAQNDLRNDQLGLQGAIYSSLDAIDAYTGKVNDGTSSTREQQQANIDVQQSFADVAQKALDTAVQQAALHGATITANGAILAQLSALQQLYSDGMLPELRKEIDEYALALYNIPGQIHTDIDYTGTDPITGRAIGGTRPEGTGAGGAGGTLDGSAVVSSIKAYEASNGTYWRTGPQ